MALSDDGLLRTLEQKNALALVTIRAAQEKWLVNIFGSVEEAEKYKDRFEIETELSFNAVPKFDDKNNIILRIESSMRIKLKPAE